MTDLRKLAEQLRREAPYTAFGASVVKFCDVVAALLDSHDTQLGILGRAVTALEEGPATPAPAPAPVTDGE